VCFVITAISLHQTNTSVFCLLARKRILCSDEKQFTTFHTQSYFAIVYDQNNILRRSVERLLEKHSNQTEEISMESKTFAGTSARRYRIVDAEEK
jgi:hypothetical protein